MAEAPLPGGLKDSGCGGEDSFLQALDRCIAAAGKGFAIGAGLRGGLVIFAVMARLRKASLLLRSSGGRIADKHLVRNALKETLRYGFFVGAFAGVYTSVDELVASLVGFGRSARWRSLVAGAIAGPSLLLTGPKTRHTSMALYILMRAAVLAARCGVKSKKVGWLFSPVSWKHGDVLLMCLSSSQILSAWILKPDTLPSSYVSFLNKHGGKDMSVVRGIRELALREPLTSLAKIQEHYRDNGTEIQLDPTMKVPCTMIHANQLCLIHFLQFIGDAYVRSLMVYLPVYLGPAVVVHRQGLLKRPFTILTKSLLGTARSSLFLATYCASAWGWTCLLFRLLNGCNPATLALGTFPTGLALTIEKKSRRMEIALYCFSRALESLGLCITSSAAFQPHHHRLPKRTDVVLFSFATSIIMHCYARERDVFRSKYLNVLDWVFGVPRSDDPVQRSVDKKKNRAEKTKEDGDDDERANCAA
ncbi:hypothetical protein SELMODRAFT_439846 [Selaginella moellendorffii]|uniref:Transmembrane protein 135 N-terminal domain-containing protein n=1 Tax=Selaginella moellendorffii TaxID=88036 RepID=D8R7R5_SELML|nr:uncharacterized protein LOC9631853 [Selaginella moellendorffii]EFJ31580.1 hypothetical protein SELMODRAFT_439846 [Selaginella moellendorffii]|eukprot:XP_002966981.1 uncharacterized protein LOC9631853 [Selaginella moellendorffii]